MYGSDADLGCVIGNNGRKSKLGMIIQEDLVLIT
jgi:hypothetical protein